MGTWKEKLGIGKDKNITVYSPIEGVTCSLDEVNDPVFQGRMLGDGVAVMPKKGYLVAPVDGTVALLFETKHAITLRSAQGAEILIHVGLNTVKLKGDHFTAYVKTNDTVRKGDLLLEFDMEKIKEAGYDLITPIVICNSDTFSQITPHPGNPVKELEPIITIKK